MFCIFLRLQENREREAAEQRRKRKESMRIAAKRSSTVSCPGSEPHLDSSNLESALHSFLSTIPGGFARCRKKMLPPVEVSPHRSQAVPTVEKTEATPPIRQGTPEKKLLKLQKKDEQLENKAEAEKMRKITRKVLHYQNSKSSLDGDKDSGTPQRSERAQNTPATPSTPQPRTRDFFFANNGDVGSPWTILSPFACTQRTPIQRNRQARQRRLSFTSSGNDLDDGVWENDEGNPLPNSSNPNSVTSPSGGCASLPECPSQRAVSHVPLLRSVSVDETRQTPSSLLRFGDLFQRSISQRSYSSGSRTESVREPSVFGRKVQNHGVDGQVSSSGFISFFRRIGGRSKPGYAEEHNFRGTNT